MRDLIAQLRAAPYGFDLFQALSLLERSEPARAPIGTSVGLDEAVRLSAAVSLAFPPSDIQAVGPSKRAGPPLTLMSTVMSMAGAHGPLPLVFTELLLERARQRDGAGLEFLDIFSQRMLAFLYRARRKHNPALGADGITRMPVVRVIDALSGLQLAQGAAGPDGENAWVRHAGLQGAAPRSMTSLLALLADRFGQRFTGRQFIGGWHPVDRGERALLGGADGGTRLGVNGILGSRVWDQASAIELRSAPLRLPQIRPFLPDDRSHALLGWTVRCHLQSDVEVRLRLALHPDEPGAAVLGGTHPPSLGHTSWLTTARVAGMNKPVLATPVVRVRAPRHGVAALRAKETSLNGN